MSTKRRAGVRRFISIVGLSLSVVPAMAAAQGWRSPLADRELVLIEKSPLGDSASARALPPPLEALLGPDYVDYEAFVATRLPGNAARSLAAKSLREARNVIEDPRMPVVLPFQSFPEDSPGERTSPWKGHRLQPAPVPGLFLLRYAFPVLSTWNDSLRECGADPMLYYGNGVFLTRARNLGVIQSCKPVARYLSWVEPFLITDRASPALLAAAGLERKPYSLDFAPGTTLDMALAELPAVVEVGGNMRWQDGTLSLGVLAGAPELEALLQTSLILLAIHPAESEPQPSDERQGQIIAGNYAGYPGAISGAVSTTGYLAWLTNRGLRTATNQQTVAVFDTGYDDGTGSTGAHHPDMENPERLIALEAEGNFVFSPTSPEIEDRRGHGTFVAGIITGAPAAAGQTDSQGFQLGTGIAPDVKLVEVQLFDSTTTCKDRSGLGDIPPTNLDNAINFSRVMASGADKALIANHSWNTLETTYTSIAKLFDDRVLDGSQATAGAQPMVMVISAGNRGQNGADKVVAPATARNVISVGSTQNYRPSSQAGAPTNDCTNGTFPEEYTREANNILEVSAFSSQGPLFGRVGQGLPLLHQTFIAPTLVAPGGKVFSLTPYQSSTYLCSKLCRLEWPAGSYYTFSSGTSFAAPVVTGVAALLRKWFLDRGVASPTPSLIKAALIATATDLGTSTSGDYRPSNKFGWGRVNLERLTDPAVPRFYTNENAGLAVSTGTERQWTRTIDNADRDTMIVLVWSDPSSPETSGHPPAVNDLRLRVDLVGGNLAWYGNNFGENIDGNDNGYSHPYVLAASAVSDTVNNVEAIFLPASTFSPGRQILIRVLGANVPQGTQKFSVYAYNVRLSS